MHSVTTADHHLSSVVLLPPNDRCKAFHRICTTLVFTNCRMAATEGVHRKTIQQLVNHIVIGEAAFVTTMNTLANTIFSIDLVDHGLDSTTSLKELVWMTMEAASFKSVSDIFPVVKCLDPQGNKRRMVSIFQSMIHIFDREEVTNKDTDVLRNNDVLDALLNLSNDPANELTISDIHHLLIVSLIVHLCHMILNYCSHNIFYK
ncbi:hypothetical protein V2J09_020295 [Rumex salicifolius]